MRGPLLAFETSDGNELRGKQIGIVLTYGDADVVVSGGINAIHTFESIFAYIGAEIVGVVHRMANKAGEVRDQPALMASALKLGQRLLTG
jgi:hypothetical protein